MQKIFVKPAREGAVVRHPEKLNHILHPEGEWVVSNKQWERYLSHGDIVLAQPPVEEKSKKTEKPAKGGAL